MFLSFWSYHFPNFWLLSVRITMQSCQHNFIISTIEAKHQTVALASDDDCLQRVCGPKDESQDDTAYSQQAQPPRVMDRSIPKSGQARNFC